MSVVKLKWGTTYEVPSWCPELSGCCRSLEDQCQSHTPTASVLSPVCLIASQTGGLGDSELGRGSKSSPWFLLSILNLLDSGLLPSVSDTLPARSLFRGQARGGMGKRTHTSAHWLLLSSTFDGHCFSGQHWWALMLSVWKVLNTCAFMWAHIWILEERDEALLSVLRCWLKIPKISSSLPFNLLLV